MDKKTRVLSKILNYSENFKRLPDDIHSEVIEALGHNGTADQCLSARSSDSEQGMSPFEKLVASHKITLEQEQRSKLSDIRISSDIILAQAAGMLAPDDYTHLERTLVDIYVRLSK